MRWCNTEEEKQSEIQCEDNTNALIFLASRPTSATEVLQHPQAAPLIIVSKEVDDNGD